MPPKRRRPPSKQSLSGREIEDVEKSSRLRAPLIYEVVRQEGDEEMDRPSFSLWWSGIAAGLSISFSLLAEAILFVALPDQPWRPLVYSLGYSVGFVLVVLARQQLFTENTITVVMPLMAEFSRTNLLRTGRIWGIVLTANLVGTFAAAIFCRFTPALSPDVYSGMLELSRQGLDHGWWETLFRAITAGFLMAAMVWLIPSAKGAELHVVVLMTYLIAISGAAHIVAGSVESFFVLLAGVSGIETVVLGFMVPALIGNIIGGTALFALIAYAQVVEEI